MPSDSLIFTLFRTLASSKPSGQFLKLGSAESGLRRRMHSCAKHKVSATDFIFADTWSSKYRLRHEDLALVKPGGLYVSTTAAPSQLTSGVVEAVRISDWLETLIFHIRDKKMALGIKGRFCWITPPASRGSA